MSTTQSIIVYRNPVEAAFWESGMVSPLIIFLVLFFVIFVPSATIINRLANQARRRGKISRRWLNTIENYATYAMILVSFAASYVLTVKLFNF